MSFAEYNNYKNREIIRKGFIKVYEEILTALNFENPSEAALIHYEIHSYEKMTYRLKDYLAHLNLVEQQNEVHNLFPQKELNQVLAKKREQLFYYLTDQKQLSLLEAMGYFLQSPKKIYYYFSSKNKKTVS